MNGYENGVSFSMVHPSLVDHCWDDAGGFLARAAEESSGRYDIFSIRQEIDTGRQQLWILFKGEDLDSPYAKAWKHLQDDTRHVHIHSCTHLH